MLLVPGFIVWGVMPGFGPYFGGLRRALRSAGADVYELAPPPIADSDARGAYLVRAIDDVRRRTGADKVAIIAHSQGGIDVRAAIGLGAASKIAVVATLSSPHQGTDLADAAVAWFPRAIVFATLDAVQEHWQYEQHMARSSADSDGALATLSRAGMRVFNAKHADAGGVPFFSIAAVSGDDVDGSCARGGKWGAPDRVGWLHPLFTPSHVMIRTKGGEESDDGVVPTSSMRFGTYLGCVPGDHVSWMGWHVGPAAFDERAFVVELWRGMRDVERAGDEHAMDAHVQALAHLAHAHPFARATVAAR